MIDLWYSSYVSPHPNYYIVYGYILVDKTIDRLIVIGPFDKDHTFDPVEKALTIAMVAQCVLQEIVRGPSLISSVVYGGKEYLCLALATNTPGELPLPTDPEAHYHLAKRIG